VSVAAARTVLGRIVARYGEPAFDGDPNWRCFPRPAVVAAADPADLPMPAARARTVVSIAARMAAGELVLDAGTDRAATRAALLEVEGVGPWTAGYLSMRATGDPDVFLASDLGVRHALAALELDPTAAGPGFAPWRSYLTHHLWAALPAQSPRSAQSLRSAKDL
jgi:AraC family transcriptional regulator of adaptative response / DNA-3-methyladenine glycosylase II